MRREVISGLSDLVRRLAFRDQRRERIDFVHRIHADAMNVFR